MGSKVGTLDCQIGQPNSEEVLPLITSILAKNCLPTSKYPATENKIHKRHRRDTRYILFLIPTLSGM